MSVINQVLIDLEKRGAAMPAADPVRAVSEPPRRARKLVLLAATMAILAGAAWGFWSGILGFPTPSAGHATPATQRAPVLPPAVQAGANLQQAHSAVAASTPPESAAGLSSRMSLDLASIASDESASSKQSGKQDKDVLPEHGKKKHRPRKKSVDKPVLIAGTDAGGNNPVKRISPEQQADNEIALAESQIKQGHKHEAKRHLENAIKLVPAQNLARQMLVGLLLENKHNRDAERILREGLHYDPKQEGFAMLLARLEVERGALQQALGTLQDVEPAAGGRADYQAFLAAILQRLGRHEEAAGHYQAALRQSPNSGVWLMGLGISLQALKRNDEARDAFRRALDSHSLSAELEDFVNRRLKNL